MSDQARPEGHEVTVQSRAGDGILLVCACGGSYHLFGFAPSVDQVLVAAMNHWREVAAVGA